MRKHPKFLTKLIHGLGAAIAFNQEIGSVVNKVKDGTWMTNPQAALQDLLYVSTGVTPQGTILPQQTTASIFSKIGGYAFIKTAMFFKKHFKV